jgi:hypothetical protein
MYSYIEKDGCIDRYRYCEIVLLKKLLSESDVVVNWVAKHVLIKEALDICEWRAKSWKVKRRCGGDANFSLGDISKFQIAYINEQV